MLKSIRAFFVLITFKRRFKMQKIKVGVIGATGMVGQNYISLLAQHPWFEVSYVAPVYALIKAGYGIQKIIRIGQFDE